MHAHACREQRETIESLGWLSDSAFVNGWESQRVGQRRAPQPGQTYTKRAAHLHELRQKNEWAIRHEDDYIRAPSPEAFSGARTFINSLPDGCLNFRLAVSTDGEINFFFGEKEELFQILIDNSGKLSYYAKSSDTGFGASDLEPESFQYFQLLNFVDRNK